ncbi:MULTISPECIES: chromate efflux transporter [unclassified Pseudovibrio]|uniref:chromate efflux transporter n=1 Tax=unclassified Pseudovibrio TaxID=2627060 RepID=UPI0007AEC3DC|nr:MULTISPECIES: chromate efflux transporter [unclassified Pseudovibrio]KZK93137.1 Chromate transport protein [Pseudovibrio sp. W74]KZL07028.1 Chromate transport protein [Pseudovibrio sp. Ad14]KZL23075.1 Chromate transport protein [Pseudovibrio sp. WM33]
MSFTERPINLTDEPVKGHVSEVFFAFLKLGLTSFGGPIAHLGYFREEIVKRRKWLSEEAYGDLVALCQFLPGPASSQVGFGLGLMRAGPLGALAAFFAFTAPSALLLFGFAYWASAFEGPVGVGLIHGLKLVAVAVVAQAVWGMARNFCADQLRAGLAVLAVVLVVAFGGAGGQIAAIVAGGLGGFLFCRSEPKADVHEVLFAPRRRIGLLSAILFAVLLFGLPVLSDVIVDPLLGVFASFYHSGSLVFGGGHVVLPLLEAEVVGKGLVSESSFLAGYGATQAVPGPLFTFAGYLGAEMQTGYAAWIGASIALLGIFLPGALLLIAGLPYWAVLRQTPSARGIMAGANAAVVGVLGAALYAPVWTSAILEAKDFAAALCGFVLLVSFKSPPWVVVVLLGLTGIGFAFI